MGFQYVIVRESWVLREPLELRARYKVIALLSSKYLKHLFSIRVQIQLVQLAVLDWQDLFEAAHFLNTFELLIRRRYNLYGV